MARLPATGGFVKTTRVSRVPPRAHTRCSKVYPDQANNDIAKVLAQFKDFKLLALLAAMSSYFAAL